MSMQHILVTGAANGIGAAITGLAARRGYQVIAADRDAQALAQRWDDQANVRSERLDVTDAEAWQALLSRLEQDSLGPDILINAAGILRSGQVGELTQQDIDQTFEINVKGTIHGTNTVAARMRQRQHGHIINMGSVASLYATPGTTLYAASKFAVRGFSIAAAGDLQPHGIAVTLFAPGPVKTDMLEQQRGDEDAALTFSGARALSPEEVAHAILGPVLDKRPVEYFLPFKDEVVGKFCNVFPRFFLGQLDKARARGRKNFSSAKF